MQLFALTYSQGVSTGYKEFIGLYSSLEKAEKAKSEDINSPKHMLRDYRGYSIKPVIVDIEYNYIYDEW